VTTNSGIKGKTVEQLRRSTEAAERQQFRSTRTTVEQLTELGSRPGMALREACKLMKGEEQ
jgi:hypothetical protein